MKTPTQTIDGITYDLLVRPVSCMKFSIAGDLLMFHFTRHEYERLLSRLRGRDNVVVKIEANDEAKYCAVKRDGYVMFVGLYFYTDCGVECMEAGLCGNDLTVPVNRLRRLRTLVEVLVANN